MGSIGSNIVMDDYWWFPDIGPQIIQFIILVGFSMIHHPAIPAFSWKPPSVFSRSLPRLQWAGATSTGIGYKMNLLAIQPGSKDLLRGEGLDDPISRNPAQSSDAAKN